MVQIRLRMWIGLPKRLVSRIGLNSLSLVVAAGKSQSRSQLQTLQSTSTKLFNSRSSLPTMAEEIPIASAAEGAANLLVQDAEAAVAPVPALDDPFPFFALHEPWDDDNGPAAHHEPDEMFADADFMHPGNHGEEPKPAPMSAYNLDVFQKCVEAGTVAVTKVANPQYESKLCNIPLECFSNVAKYLDPDSVSKLFGSCVALFAVGQHPTTRIEFLLGRYGTYSVVDGVSLHAKLVCDRVLEGVFRRVNEKLGKVPR